MKALGNWVGWTCISLVAVLVPILAVLMFVLPRICYALIFTHCTEWTRYVQKGTRRKS